MRRWTWTIRAGSAESQVSVYEWGEGAESERGASRWRERLRGWGWGRGMLAASQSCRRHRRSQSCSRHAAWPAPRYQPSKTHFGLLPSRTLTTNSCSWKPLCLRWLVTSAIERCLFHGEKGSIWPLRHITCQNELTMDKRPTLNHKILSKTQNIFATLERPIFHRRNT